MLNKTIRVSESTHGLLSGFASKNDTFDDVIVFLIDYYNDNNEEELSPDLAKFYNEEIDRIENGIFENVSEITLSEIEERISKLENEILKQ